MSTGAESQESGSPPPSPAESNTSDAAPTLVHIKQENMPPDLKEYYSALDFDLSEPYHTSPYQSHLHNFRHNPYLPTPLDLPNSRIDPPKDNEHRISSEDGSKDTADDCSESGMYEGNLPIELVLKKDGVYARASIPNGTRYGPFKGKWKQQPIDRRYAWEVRICLLLFMIHTRHGYT